MCTCSRATASGTVAYHGHDDKEALATIDEADDSNVSRNACGLVYISGNCTALF